MGNSLLDFVMALVRDPAVSARYAADPAGVLADANLSGVTIADVNNLIPVVTDSLAAATPGFGATADPTNVWTSGAAAAAFDAFDAFDIHVPPAPYPLTAATSAPHQPAVTSPPAASDSGQTVYDHPVAEAASAPAAAEAPAYPPLERTAPDWVDDGALHPHVEPQTEHRPGDPSGLDLF